MGCGKKGCCSDDPCRTCSKKCPKEASCVEDALCAIKGINVCDERYQNFTATAPIVSVTITDGAATLPIDANKIKVYANGQRIPFGLAGNYFFTRSGANIVFNKTIPASTEEPTWITVEWCDNKTIEDIVLEEFPDIDFCC